MSLDDLPELIKAKLRAESEYKAAAHKRTEAGNRFSLTELLYCMRKAYWDRTDPLPKTLEALWRMKHGELLDNWYTSAFPRHQQRVTLPMPAIGATVSGVFDVEDEDGAIADLKAMKSVGPIGDKGPSNHQIEQVAFYCFCESRKVGRIHAASHDDFVRVDVVLSIDEKMEIVKDIERRAGMLLCCLRDGIVPEDGEMVSTAPYRAPCPRYPWECDGCQYYARCFK